MIRLESLRLYHPVSASWFTRIVHVQSDIIHGLQYIVSAWRCLHSLSVSLHYTTLTCCILHILHLCYVLRSAKPLKFNQFWGVLRQIFPNYGYLVWYFMHSWCLGLKILWYLRFYRDMLIVSAFGPIKGYWNIGELLHRCSLYLHIAQPYYSTDYLRACPLPWCMQ